jgi:hypothetical protein
MEYIREYREPAAGTPLTITGAFTLARACTRRAYADIYYKPTGMQFSTLCSSCRHQLHLYGTRSGLR